MLVLPFNRDHLLAIQETSPQSNGLVDSMAFLGEGTRSRGRSESVRFKLVDVIMKSLQVLLTELSSSWMN
jgi:hypothetical protein